MNSKARYRVFRAEDLDSFEMQRRKPYRWSVSPEHLVPRAIGYDETWRIFVNVAPEELHGIAGLGKRKVAGRVD